jgi:hypothetical protein
LPVDWLLPFFTPLAELACQSPVARLSIDNNSPDSMSFVEHYVLRRGRLIDKRREAKKTIAIATVYPTRSAVIVISK